MWLFAFWVCRNVFSTMQGSQSRKTSLCFSALAVSCPWWVRDITEVARPRRTGSLYCIERLWKFFENIDIRHIKRNALLHSCYNVTNSSTHLLGTLRGLLMLRVHKWLLPLLSHGTKEDSLALTLGLGSSVTMPQSCKRPKIKGNVARMAEVGF